MIFSKKSLILLMFILLPFFIIYYFSTFYIIQTRSNKSKILQLIDKESKISSHDEKVWNINFQKISENEKTNMLLFELHVYTFIENGNCEKSLKLYDLDYKRNFVQYHGRNELLTFLMFIECGRKFAISRYTIQHDHFLKKIISVKNISSRVDQEWAESEKNNNEFFLENGLKFYDERFYIGLRCFSSDSSDDLYLKVRNKKWKEYFRQLTTSLLFINGNWKVFIDWLEKRVKFRLIKYVSKYIIIINNNNEEEGDDGDQKWKVYFDDVYFVKEKYINYREEFFEKYKRIALKNNDAVFFLSIGEFTPGLVKYMWDINNRNTYLDVGSAIDFLREKPSFRENQWMVPSQNSYGFYHCRRLDVSGNYVEKYIKPNSNQPEEDGLYLLPENDCFPRYFNFFSKKKKE